MLHSTLDPEGFAVWQQTLNQTHTHTHTFLTSVRSLRMDEPKWSNLTLLTLYGISYWVCQSEHVTLINNLKIGPTQWWVLSPLHNTEQTHSRQDWQGAEMCRKHWVSENWTAWKPIIEVKLINSLSVIVAVEKKQRWPLIHLLIPTLYSFLCHWPSLISRYNPSFLLK